MKKSSLDESMPNMIDENLLKEKSENTEPQKSISNAEYDLPPIPIVINETLNYYYVDKEEENLIESGRMWIGDKFTPKNTNKTI